MDVPPSDRCHVGILHLGWRSRRGNLQDYHRHFLPDSESKSSKRASSFSDR